MTAARAALVAAALGLAGALAWRSRRRGLAGATLPDRERENVHRAVADEVDDAVERAARAGADGELEYIGAGGEGIVFCTGAKAYKVARKGRSLRDEAAFFKKANQVPGVREHVAKFHRYDEANEVLVRECVRGERPRWGHDTKAYNLADEIAARMKPYGFTAPERKPDSYVRVRGRGLVLVDGGYVHRLGTELVRHVLDIVNGRKKRGVGEDNQMLAFEIRAERDDGRIPPAVAERVLAKLRART